MIFWDEYKKFKKLADELIAKSKICDSPWINLEIEKLRNGKVTNEQAVEEIINILSDYKHKQPL